MSFLKLRIHRKRRIRIGVFTTLIDSVNNTKATFHV